MRNGTGAKVATSVGCDGAADIAACLRGKSIAEIVAAVPGTFTVLPRLLDLMWTVTCFPISRSG